MTLALEEGLEDGGLAAIAWTEDQEHLARPLRQRAVQPSPLELSIVKWRADLRAAVAAMPRHCRG